MVRKSAIEADLLLWRRAVGKVIAGLRDDKDLSQPKFGKLMGWSRDKVSKVEQGRREIEYGDIVHICRVLGEKLQEVLELIHAKYARLKSKRGD